MPGRAPERGAARVTRGTPRAASKGSQTAPQPPLLLPSCSPLRHGGMPRAWRMMNSIWVGSRGSWPLILARLAEGLSEPQQRANPSRALALHPPTPRIPQVHPRSSWRTLSLPRLGSVPATKGRHDGVAHPLAADRSALSWSPLQIPPRTAANGAAECRCLTPFEVPVPDRLPEAGIGDRTSHCQGAGACGTPARWLRRPTPPALA
mmetsp:Transcript_22290/g.62548  ORF Transcript_22290/g.62548 Transcript_22290/m.62548 type:complete len:206 (+) Transcript_22290:587-1204(+)